MVDFLRQLAATHSVSAAARSGGRTRSSAYRLRNRLKGQPFDIAWEAAFRHGYDNLAHAALDRALNGVAVALTCGLGVWVWSQSIGLVLVISVSMVLAMVMAGFAGAVVPMALTRLGQDPAQSSTIVLTTVTDIAGFLSFLGIATLLSRLL